MRQLILLSCSIFLAAVSSSLFAQSILDPYQISGSNPAGTARYNALGGAMSSVGGDGSAVTLNPAGGAMFLNSQADLSLSLFNKSSDVLGQNASASQLALPSANVMFHLPVANSNWKALNFGLTSSRQQNLGQNIIYRQNTAVGNSMVDFFLARADGIPVEDLEFEDPYGWLAYQAFIIDTVGGMPGLYTSSAKGESQQRIEFVRSGRTNDVDFSFSGNYDNKIYIGASLGFSSILVNNEFTSIESFEDSSITQVAFRETNDREGSAFLFKVGAIFRPIESLRISAYYHAPRLYRLTSLLDIAAEASFETGPPETSAIAFEQFLYRYRLPARMGVGFSYILSKTLLVSMDFERMNLRSTQLAALPNELGGGADPNFFSFENSQINSGYSVLNTVRFGLEAKLKNVYLRGGVQYRSNPLSKEFSDFSEQLTISGGIGYRMKTMSLDFFASHASNTEGVLPYTGAVLQKVTHTAINMGVGASFFF